MALLLRHFIIILQTKLIILCEETNINSNSKGGLRITKKNDWTSVKKTLQD